MGATRGGGRLAMTDMERTRLAEADLRIAKCKAHPSLSKKHSADGSARPIYVTRGIC